VTLKTGVMVALKTIHLIWKKLLEETSFKNHSGPTKSLLFKSIDSVHTLTIELFSFAYGNSSLFCKSD